jgi:hypothetical protein
MIVVTCLAFAVAAALVGILAGTLAFWSLALAVAAGLAGIVLTLALFARALARLA